MTAIDYRALKAANAELNLRETREGTVELASMPRFVMFELTQGCNLSCPMCRSRAIAYQERVLDRGIVRQVAEVLLPAAEIVDIRGWGESLLAPDINDMIGLVAGYEARCRVVSNLSLTRPDTFDLLVDTGSMIDISLDAADQDLLNVCRPGARLSLITRNARRIMGRLAAAGGDPASVRVLATIQSTTLPALTGLVRWAAEIGIPQIVFNEVTLSPGDPLAVVGLEDEVDAAVGAAREEAERLGVEIFAGSALGRCVGVKKDVAFCIHPWAYATIGWDGSVGYCDHLIGPLMPLTCLGDITQDSFRDIWNGEPWQNLRRWHTVKPRAEDETYRGCLNCYKHRNIDFEDVFEPRLERFRLTVTPLRTAS